MANLVLKADKIESCNRILEVAYENLSAAITAQLPEEAEKSLEIIDHVSWQLERNMPYNACIYVDGLSVACTRHTIGEHLLGMFKEHEATSSKKDQDLIFRVEENLGIVTKTLLDYVWQRMM